MRYGLFFGMLFITLMTGMLRPAWSGENLLDDPSFEISKERNKFGHVFVKWGGWKYAGEAEFRVGKIAHTGKHSCLMYATSSPKLRVYKDPIELEPGRYRITAFMRGLDIGTGNYNQTTEFSFNGKYMQLNKNGSFGWTPITYVADIKEKRKVQGPAFGLMAPGYFWIDDIKLEKIEEGEAEPTPQPVIGQEEKPIAAPSEIAKGEVRCPDCGYRNMPVWKSCYACGDTLKERAAKKLSGPDVKLITSFEDKSPFNPGKVVEEHATDGAKSLRIDKSYASMDGKQDWTGYDYLMVDCYTDSDKAQSVYVEIRDAQTKGYWTRMNYTTIVPPGKSTLILGNDQLFVGEKSRPGRKLILDQITRLVFSVGPKPQSPLFIDNIRLVRDTESAKVQFDGLYAFDLGLDNTPLMEGFKRLTPGTLYSKGRGFGLKGVRIWRPYNVLQPEPLYQDFLCIEKGGLAIDVPNGKYHVFLNMDNPSGFWGEYQKYKSRTVVCEGKEAIKDTMDLEAFKKKYFRFWEVEDMPTDNTFDKYQDVYYDEKEFDVDVTDGQLNIEFNGYSWACSVSAIIVYPADKTEEGKKFLKFVEDRRRFHFDNYFKRVLHKPVGDPLAPTAADKGRGYVVYSRDYMECVYYNDTPRKGEIVSNLEGSAFAGEYEPITLSVYPLKSLGRTNVEISDLKNVKGSIPADVIDVGFISYRVTRKTMDGAVYTISPRLIMPKNSVAMPKDINRRFWLTVKVPKETAAGIYKGALSIVPEKGKRTDLPVSFRVLKGNLDYVDVAAGPWGHTIGLPWFGNDPEMKAWQQAMRRKSLVKLKEYGFTSFSGMPVVIYKGFRSGEPQLDFSIGDAQMKLARELGFSNSIGLSGFAAII